MYVLLSIHQSVILRPYEDAGLRAISHVLTMRRYPDDAYCSILLKVYLK